MGEGLTGSVACLLFYLIFDAMGKIPGMEIAETFKWFMVLLAGVCVFVAFVSILKEP